MIIEAARECYDSKMAESSEELRRLSLMLIRSCIDSADDSDASLLVSSLSDVLSLTTKGLQDEYFAVRTCACDTLGALIPKATGTIDDSTADELCRLVAGCCVSRKRRLRESAVRCLTQFVTQHSQIVSSTLSRDLLESLTVDQAPQVRVSFARFLCACAAYIMDCEILYLSIAMCFDDDKDVVAEALRVFHVDPSDSYSLVYAISNRVADMVPSTELISRLVNVFEGPMMIMTDVSRNIAIKAIPVIASRLYENDSDLGRIFDIMVGNHVEKSVHVACGFLPFEETVQLLSRTALDPAKTMAVSSFIGHMEILNHMLRGVESVSGDTTDKLCSWLERFFVDGCLTESTARKVIKFCNHLSRISVENHRVDSTVIFAETVLGHDKDTDTRQESYVREMERLIEAGFGKSSFAKQRQIMIHLLRRIETNLDERLCPIVCSLVTSSVNPQVRIDGLEMVHIMSNKGFVSSKVVQAVFTNMHYSNSCLRKIALFVILEISEKHSLVWTKEMVACVLECSSDPWSPDRRYLGLKILEQVLPSIETTELGETIDACIARFDDSQEQVRNIAFKIIGILGESSRLLPGTISRILSELRLHAQVSVMAQDCLRKLE